MKNDLVNLTIDGKPVQVAPGTTLLLAAKANHIDIPTLCYHPELKPEGHCRLCVVEIGEAPRTRLVNSCTYPAEPGLVVQTASEKVLASRRMVMELLLAQAPAAEHLKEMAAASRFFFEAPAAYEDKAARKHLTPETGAVLEQARTALAGIMRLVEQAQSSKSRAQALADRAAFLLTIIAVASAVVTAIVWLALGAQGSYVVERVVTVLVIACPHALGLAVPLVIAISTTRPSSPK